MDDNTILINMENLGYKDKATHMIDVAKKCFGIWQRLVHATGGELELTKSCFFHNLETEVGGAEELSTSEEEPGSLSIRSNKYPGMDVELRRNSVQDAEKILGVRLALDGGDEAEFSYRLDQATALAGKVTSSPFSRYDTKVIYNQRWISSVRYCLTITQFTDSQCSKIQQPAYNAILPKIGFNRHFSRAVIFGPVKYQGKQMIDYKIFQYTSHLVRFVGYLRQKQELGNVLRIQMDQYQLLIGSDNHFLELSSDTYPYGERSRIQMLWEQNIK